MGEYDVDLERVRRGEGRLEIASPEPGETRERERFMSEAHERVLMELAAADAHLRENGSSVRELLHHVARSALGITFPPERPIVPAANPTPTDPRVPQQRMVR